MKTSYTHNMTDKYGSEYSVEVSFDTLGMLPVDYMAINKDIMYSVKLKSLATEKESQFDVSLASTSMFLHFGEFSEELGLQAKIDRMGDIAAGKYVTEISIDFSRHYEDMVVNMVNDFIAQFDSLSPDNKMRLIETAIGTENKSLHDLVKTLFENTVEIKNFLAIDRTGELKKQMEKSLNDAISKGRISITNIFPDKEYEDAEEDIER